ncbi:MAG: hypothetical protein HOO85_06330 [Methylotenera sp.]|nr:hypothetical protein [Methylotenera sp.]
MQPPKVKRIKVYLVIATTIGTVNSVQAMQQTPPSTSTPTQTSESSIHNSIYAALKWTFGESFKPEAVVGLRHAKVDSNGDTDGSDISISTKFIGGFELGKLRAKYFNGNETIQGEIGGGYDFVKGIFAGVGVKAPYSNIGVDYQYSNENHWLPYFMLDTLKKYDKPHQTLTCPANNTLNGNTCASNNIF